MKKFSSYWNGIKKKETDVERKKKKYAIEVAEKERLNVSCLYERFRVVKTKKNKLLYEKRWD